MTSTALLRRLWSFTPGYRRSLLIGLVLLTAAALVDVLAVLVMAGVLDGILSSSSGLAAARGVAAWVGVTLGAALLTYLGAVAATRAAEGTVLSLRDAVLGRLLDLPFAEATRLSTGDLVVRLTEDVVVLETAMSVSVVQAVIAILTTTGLIAVALALSWQLTLIALLAVPVLMGVARAFRSAQARVADGERSAHSELGTVIGETVASVEHIQLHNMQAAELAVVHDRGASLLNARVREARVQAAFGGVLGSAQTMTLIAVTVAGLILVRQGTLSLGTMIALTGYLAYLYPRIQDIAECRLALVAAQISADRLAEAAGGLPERIESDARDRGGVVGVADHDGVDGGAGALPGLPVEIAGLRLRRSDEFTLDCAALRAEPGQITVITGPSGSGKSTLAEVIAAMTDADAGTVRIGERDARSMSPTAVRDLVTVVPQRVAIRTGTIGSNIAYGGRGADPAPAAALAGVDEFALTLADGYDSPTTFGGQELSGGQRQRIGLARGLTRPTPVLILDEPSTGLDRANTERLVRVLRTVSAGRTVIVITHDPLLEAAADRCYRVVDGRVGTPTHEIPANY
jgi:ATP-binding cassette subfamily B protein